MTSWMWFVAGAVGGLLLAAVLARFGYAARTAGLVAERDLLRDRVEDLEDSLAEDLETAALLAPLTEALGRVERQVGTLERDRVEQFGSVRSVLARVESETAEVGRATSALAGSLRSSTVRGSWGEVQLRRVLEHAGMLARCDFDEQVQLVADGRRRRPDVIVHLPGEKHLVVDAKSPMAAFLDAQSEDLDEDERSALLGEHARALRTHVGELAAREYWTGLSATPEMVVCFVPSDAVLASALARDAGLHDWALERRVVLVGPGALLALLRTVAFTWHEDSLAESARELLEVGRELYRRIGTLGSHLSRLGRTLRSGVEAYNAVVGTLETRVLVTARRMHDLDVVTDPLPSLESVDSTPRVLGAVELLEAVAEPHARDDLLEPAPERRHRDGMPA